MAQGGFTDIRTFECLLKGWGLTRKNLESGRSKLSGAAPEQSADAVHEDGNNEVPVKRKYDQTLSKTAALVQDVPSYLSYPLATRGHTSYLTFSTRQLEHEHLQPTSGISVAEILKAGGITE
jgi:hypothetical protein